MQLWGLCAAPWSFLSELFPSGRADAVLANIPVWADQWLLNTVSCYLRGVLFLQPRQSVIPTLKKKHKSMFLNKSRRGSDLIFVNGWVSKQDVVCTSHGALFSLRRKQILYFCSMSVFKICSKLSQSQNTCWMILLLCCPTLSNSDRKWISVAKGCGFHFVRIGRL